MPAVAGALQESHWEHWVSAQQSQGSLALSSPSHLGWCPLRGRRGKVLLSVTLLGRVADKPFDGSWVALSWKIIHGNWKQGDKCNGVMPEQLVSRQARAGLVLERLLSRGLWVVKTEREEEEKPLKGRLPSSSWHGQRPALLWHGGMPGPEPLPWQDPAAGLCIASLRRGLLPARRGCRSHPQPPFAQGRGVGDKMPVAHLADNTRGEHCWCEQ